MDIKMETYNLEEENNYQAQNYDIGVTTPEDIYVEEFPKFENENTEENITRDCTLRQRNGRALAEEPQSTLSALAALDAIRKMQLGCNIGSFHKDLKVQMDIITKEIRSLSEKYSTKCLESATLENKLEAVRKQLSDANKKNKQLTAILSTTNSHEQAACPLENDSSENPVEEDSKEPSSEFKKTDSPDDVKTEKPEHPFEYATTHCTVEMFTEGPVLGILGIEDSPSALTKTDLPLGWERKYVERKNFAKGKARTDIFYKSPTGKTLRSKKEVVRYCKEEGLEDDLQILGFSDKMIGSSACCPSENDITENSLEEDNTEQSSKFKKTEKPEHPFEYAITHCTVEMDTEGPVLGIEDSTSALTKADLPPGWIRKCIERKNYANGKARTDILYTSPTGKTLRSRNEVIRYCKGEGLEDDLQLFGFYFKQLDKTIGSSVLEYPKILDYSSPSFDPLTIATKKTGNISGSRLTEDNQDPNIPCEECGKEFRTLKTLRAHMKSHLEVKEVLCPYCDEVFPQRHIFHTHLVTVHQQASNLTCPVCKKVFTKKCSLESHMVRKHNKNGGINCSICSKPFPSQGQLKMHFRVHTGERPFKCDYCNKRFVQKVHLRAHVQSMHNMEIIQNTPCRICFTMCNGQAQLKDHYISVHGLTKGEYEAEVAKLRKREKIPELPHPIVKEVDPSLNCYKADCPSENDATEIPLEEDNTEQFSEFEKTDFPDGVKTEITDHPFEYAITHCAVEMDTEDTVLGQEDSPSAVTKADLPPGWKLKCVERKNYANGQSRTDKFYTSPTGKRFRSRNEVIKYCQEEGLEGDLQLFGFPLQKIESPKLQGASVQQILQLKEVQPSIFQYISGVLEKHQGVPSQEIPQLEEVQPSIFQNISGIGEVQVISHENQNNINTDSGEPVTFSSSSAAAQQQTTELQIYPAVPSNILSSEPEISSVLELSQEADSHKHWMEQMETDDSAPTTNFIQTPRKRFACTCPNCKQAVFRGSKKFHNCHIPGCNKEYAKSSHLKSHLLKHSGEMPFNCSICDQSFRRSDELMRHLHTHTGEKPFHCSECNKSFHRSDHLSKHMKTHNKLNFADGEHLNENIINNV